ncbi:MAG: hypothetical protein WC804_04025 [Sphingomonas sp.]|jgi:hypothetical protein|uniref:hypothetical protein n=1 Tax=Sphingomonas sp. TaxID=28214 RepID=UPI0035670B77
MQKAFSVLVLALLGGCTADNLNMAAVSACQDSPNCTVTDTRTAGGPPQQRAIAPENQQRPH